MRVALVIEKFSAAGGAERACAGLAKGLVQRGHEVHVFARHIDPLPGITPHPVDATGLHHHATFAGRSRALLEKERFDVIHSFTRTSCQDVLRLGGGVHQEYLDRTGVAYSTLGRLWRRFRPKEREELRLERESLQPSSSKRIVAVSKRVKEEVVRHYGVLAERIDVIYNGVDAGEFKPNPEARRLIRNQLAIDDAEYLLLFCGSGFKRKGLQYAIRAVDRVPSAKLAVAGEGRAPRHPRVCMLGRRTDVAHLYAAADAFILPTLYDPFPNAALEAMASGLPVIVSRVAGVSEIIDGDSMVIEDPTNIGELTAAIRKLEDPAVRKPMGEAARRKSLLYPVERVVEDTLKVYESVRPPH